MKIARLENGTLCSLHNWRIALRLIVFLSLSYLKLSYFELRLRAWHWGQIRQIHNEFQSPTKGSGMDSHWIPVFFSRFFWHSSLFKLTVFCRCNSNQCSDVIWLMRQPIRILADADDRKGFHFQYKRQLIKCCLTIIWSNLSYDGFTVWNQELLRTQ